MGVGRGEEGAHCRGGASGWAPALRGRESVFEVALARPRNRDWLVGCRGTGSSPFSGGCRGRRRPRRRCRGGLGSRRRATTRTSTVRSVGQKTLAGDGTAPKEPVGEDAAVVGRVEGLEAEWHGVEKHLNQRAVVTELELGNWSRGWAAGEDEGEREQEAMKKTGVDEAGEHAACELFVSSASWQAVRDCSTAPWPSVASPSPVHTQVEARRRFA
ncbi:hypothetical protein BJ546DRAFT_192951 [Cryomyces antarcticus]